MAQSAKYDVNAGITADVDAAVAAARGLKLLGFNARESDGTPAVATAYICDTDDASDGPAVIKVELAANESKTVWFGHPGIDFSNGISIDHIAGTLDITLFYADDSAG